MSQNFDIDFQYIREHKKFNINKNIRKTLFVSLTSLIFVILLLVLGLKIEMNSLNIIFDSVLILIVSFSTFRFIKQLKFEELQLQKSKEEISSKILHLLQSSNIEYEMDEDQGLIIIKSRNLYSSSKVNEYVFILIDDNRILINNMIKGSSFIHTGLRYPYKKQYGVLKGKIRALFNPEKNCQLFALS